MRVLAFDTAPASRRFDADGRLHLADQAITKACVSGYRGREIPNYRRLGLDADRVYSLLRDPDELSRAAHTFCNLPILSMHAAVNAGHRPELVVGTTGSRMKWAEPYLFGDLAIWAKAAIDTIENGAARELSAAYHYTPVMEPGSFAGQRFDGRMTNLRANHLALVDRGRVRDVAIGADEWPRPRARPPRSRAALPVAAHSDLCEMFPEAARIHV